jgi:bla regulator protein blaR1
VAVAVMLYSLCATSVLAVAAAAVERLFGALRWPRRGVWLFALVTSVILTVKLMYDVWYPSVSPPEFLMPPFVQHIGVRLLGMMPIPASAVNMILLSAWGTSTCLSLLFEVSSWIRLQALSRGWARERVDDLEVVLSDYHGPGAYGFLRPRIVIPRWLLDVDCVTRSVALNHEREHAEVGDPLLSAIGLLMFTAMTWNFALAWQLRRFKLAVEIDCDARVVRSNPSLDAGTYSNALMHLWRRRHGRESAAMPGPKSDVWRRVCILLAGSLTR